MRNIARLLIAEELRSRDASAADARPALRVCDKLGRSLAGMAGGRGAQSLLRRAVALATREAPWLAELTATAEGTLEVGLEAQAEIKKKESAAGGVVLVTTLLELLVTLIGEALTLRIAQQIWPKAALNGRNSGGKA